MVGNIKECVNVLPKFKECESFTLSYNLVNMSAFLNVVKKLKPISFNVLIHDNYSISFSSMIGDCGYYTCHFNNY